MIPMDRKLLLQRTGILAAVLLAVLLLPGVRELELWSHDARMKLRGPRPPRIDNIVVVAIDDASRQFFRSPSYFWSPNWAQFLEKAVQASASAVMFDIFFSMIPDKPFQAFVGSFMAENGILIPPAILGKMSLEQIFRNAIGNARKRGLKIFLGMDASETLKERLKTNPILMMIPVGNLGLFTTPSDEDRIIRRIKLFYRTVDGERTNSAISLVVASKTSTLPFEIRNNRELSIGGEELSMLTDGHTGILDFAYPTFPTISFKDLFDGTLEKEHGPAFLAGKILLVGEIDRTDVKRTPLGLAPGVAVHANAIENLFTKGFLVPSSILFEWALIGLLAVLQFALFAWNPRIGVIASMLFPFAWFGAGIMMIRRGFLLPFAHPTLFVFISGIAEGIRRYRLLEKDRRKIREVFGRYVNDSVLNTIMGRTGRDFISGDRHTICVMFVDIRGFTSFSESRDPADVVAFLNKYFECLTEIVLRHDGVVDKFLGDGLMAFFNAPIEKPEFASQAVKAALEMRRLAENPEIRKACGSFDLKIGVALNVGPAVVGNIGSNRKTEYTIIGDTVNTTSRIESLNKEYGTDIIAGESVFDLTRDEFEWKNLGERSIRGKEILVKLFSPVGPIERTVSVPEANKEVEP